MSQDAMKQRAADAALEWLPEAGVVGLGSGSTAALFIAGVGRLIAAGRQLVGVPTSQASRRQAEGLGIPLLEDDGPWDIAVCVDGADEVSASLDLIKGGGGCHTREKIVAHASRSNVIVVDESKLSSQLGERWPVPVEVLPFGRAATVRALGAFGEVRLRERNGAPWLTDSGNYLYDVHAGVIAEPGRLDVALRGVPGVVETGLFVGRAAAVIVARADRIEILRRP